MTTPSSLSGTGGQWQNQAYGVNNCQPLYQSNQIAGPGTQPIVAAGVAGTKLGGAGSFNNLIVVPVSAYTGYEFSFSLGCAIGPVQGGQICRIDVYWFDSLADNFPVDHVRFDCPVSGSFTGPTSGTLTWGHGPHAGNWMAVQFTDKTGLASGIIGYFSMSGTTRNWTSHDWRSDGGLSSFSASAATPYTNELCMVSAANVPVSSTINRQIFLYSGNAFLHAENPGTAGTINVQIVDDDNLEICNIHPAIGANADLEILMPRKLCWLNIINSSGSAAGTANVALIADRI